MSRPLRLWLSPAGVQGLAPGQAWPAVDDAPAQPLATIDWQAACAQALAAADGRVGAVQALVDDRLAPPALLCGPLVRLSPQALGAVARQWYDEQLGLGAPDWQVRCVPQADGRHLAACAMPAALVQGLQAAVVAAGGRLRSLRPRWAQALGGAERLPARRARLVAAPTAAGLALGLRGPCGSWQALAVEAGDAGPWPQRAEAWARRWQDEVGSSAAGGPRRSGSADPVDATDTRNFTDTTATAWPRLCLVPGVPWPADARAPGPGRRPDPPPVHPVHPVPQPVLPSSDWPRRVAEPWLRRGSPFSLARLDFAPPPRLSPALGAALAGGLGAWLALGLAWQTLARDEAAVLSVASGDGLRVAQRTDVADGAGRAPRGELAARASGEAAARDLVAAALQGQPLLALDRLAAARDAGVQLQRIESVAGRGPAVRWRVQVQADTPQAALAWYAQLSRAEGLHGARLLGWQAAPEGEGVLAELELGADAD
ncbi:hypothetical protein AACH10_19740 [Ideonella sp. DXS22W]|uniref:GspL cytoplasmic actin-ATPase-like domain-containing protein n=1 Tax=Pseudaquabacterium inlustre TaxID=2984192 RepID=A0ABU9CKZ6_9BURK